MPNAIHPDPLTRLLHGLALGPDPLVSQWGGALLRERGARSGGQPAAAVKHRLRRRKKAAKVK